MPSIIAKISTQRDILEVRVGGAGEIVMFAPGVAKGVIPDLFAAAQSALTALYPGLATPVNAAFTAGAGTLGNATYFYRVTAIDAEGGETLPSAETSLVIAAGPQGVNVNWAAVTGAQGYRIYGRATGAELFIAQVGPGVLTFLDSGAITPAGALPTANTTLATATAGPPEL